MCMKVSTTIVSLIMISCSGLMGMKTYLEADLHEFFKPLKIYTLDRAVQDALTNSVKRTMRSENKDEQPMIAWPQVRNDLQKVHGNNNALRKKAAIGLCLLSAVNTAWFGSWAGNGMLKGNEATWDQHLLTGVAVLLLLDNIIQLTSTVSSWKRSNEVLRQNDLYSQIVKYVQANPNDDIQEIVSAIALAGKSLTKSDHDKLKACALSGESINKQMVEQLFDTQSHFYSMSDDERNMCAFMFFLNTIPIYFCSSVMGPDFAQMGTYMAGLNLIAGLCTLGNPRSVCGSRKIERNLNDILDTIDKHVSKKADHVIPQ